MSRLVVRITSAQVFRSGCQPYQALFTVSSFSVRKPWQVAMIQQMSILCHSDGVNRHSNEAEISWPHWSILQVVLTEPVPNLFNLVKISSATGSRKVFDGKEIRWISQSIFTGPVTLTSPSKGCFTALQILLQHSRFSAIQCFGFQDHDSAMKRITTRLRLHDWLPVLMLAPKSKL